MASPAVLSLPPRPPLRAHDAHWLAFLEMNFEQVRREARAELVSNHPGARHRVATLLALGANLAAEIEALGAER